MRSNTISHRGISAWLQDDNGPHQWAAYRRSDKCRRLSYETNRRVFIHFSRRFTEKVSNKNYTIEWGSANGKPLNARCDIFRKQKDKLVRIGNHWMAADDPKTQFRSSRGRLEVPQERDAFLRVRNPPSGGIYAG